MSLSLSLIHWLRCLILKPFSYTPQVLSLVTSLVPYPFALLSSSEGYGSPQPTHQLQIFASLLDLEWFSRIRICGFQEKFYKFLIASCFRNKYLWVFLVPDTLFPIPNDSDFQCLFKFAFLWYLCLLEVTSSELENPFPFVSFLLTCSSHLFVLQIDVPFLS